MASGRLTPFFRSNVSAAATRETLASLNAGSRQRNLPRKDGTTTMATAKKNKPPSTSGKSQMSPSIAKASWVAPGRRTPIPENTLPMAGAIAKFHKRANTVEIKKAMNMTISGYTIRLFSRVQMLLCR